MKHHSNQIKISNVPLTHLVQGLYVEEGTGEYNLSKPRDLKSFLHFISGHNDCLCCEETYDGLIFESSDQGEYALTGERINLYGKWLEEGGFPIIAYIHDEMYMVIPD